MSLLEHSEPECTRIDRPAVELDIRAHTRDLGGGFTVRRLLPSAARRMVGPFVFFDHMGPVRLPAGEGLDVRPHPHINLATVTYLFDGEILHRDSLGSEQPIRPGAVNWMTAGRGIVHSERTPAAQRATGPSVHGLQLWLALGFLLVCMTNIVALLLAKFLRRSGEISVRRALGARRRDIFLQLGIESAVIGVGGGVLGLLIAQLGLWSVRHRPDDYAQLAQMDVSMLLGTLVLAIAANILAGLLPAWRACRVASGHYWRGVQLPKVASHYSMFFNLACNSSVFGKRSLSTLEKFAEIEYRLFASKSISGGCSVNSFAFSLSQAQSSYK